MSIIFVHYPRCTTCKRAQKVLDELGIVYTDRHIKEEPLTKDELVAAFKKSGLESKRFFNTSGQRYRELELKDRLPEMSDDERFELLATDGMLVKRPLLIGDDFCLVGFREEDYRTKAAEIGKQ